MSEKMADLSSKPSWWFWLISIVALLWFLMDASAFVMRVFMLESMIKDMPKDQAAMYLSMPQWVNTVFALEVVGGLFASIALLLKNRRALTYFAISIAGVGAQASYVILISDARSVMGAPAVIMPLMALAIGVGLVYFSRVVISKGWIK